MALLDLGYGELPSMVLQKRNGRWYLTVKGLRPRLELCVEFCSGLPLPRIAGELLIPELIYRISSFRPSLYFISQEFLVGYGFTTHVAMTTMAMKDRSKRLTLSARLTALKMYISELGHMSYGVGIIVVGYI